MTERPSADRPSTPDRAANDDRATWIGLAIVRWAVSLHGGTIEVADSDHGATMRLRLPAPVLERAPGSPDEANPEEDHAVR